MTARPRAAPATPADPWQRYLALPPGPKMVLRLKALLGQPMAKPLFIQCVLHGNLPPPGLRAWHAGLVNEALNDLISRGMLAQDLTCPAALMHPVAVDAVASPDGPALLEAVRSAFPLQPGKDMYGRPQRPDPQSLARLIRLEIYANDAERFAAVSAAHDRGYAPLRTMLVVEAAFAGTPLAVPWFESRHPALQAALLEAKLARVGAAGVVPPDLAALVSASAARLAEPGFAAVRQALPTYLLLDGKLEEVRHSLAGLEDAGDGAVLAAQGTVAFLAGENDAALRLYREALKRRRKHHRRRKLFLEDMHGPFFLLALLRAHDATLHAEVQAGLDILLETPSAAHTGAALAVQVLLWLAQGLELKAREALRTLLAELSPEPLVAALLALAEYAMDPALPPKRRAELATGFDYWKGSLALIARVLAEILVAAGEVGPHRAWLEAESGGVKVRFTDIVTISPPWQRALESLGAFLDPSGGGPEATKAAVKARRLVWFLDPETGTIEPVEQSAKGRDGWSDGRAVAPRRLHEQAAKLDYLTDADRAVLRCLRKDPSRYHNPDYVFDQPRALLALIGHPLVFDAGRRGQRLELVRYPLELVVTETQAGYRVALSHSSNAPTVFLEAETPNRWRVIEFPQRLLAVQETLTPQGLTVPAEGRDRLLALIRRGNPSLPIRAEIADLDQPGIEGSPTPVVQLVPEEEGLRLRLVVRPFGSQGPAYMAGLGGRSVLASIDGRHLRAQRDLEREVAELRALIAACPTLRDRAGPEAQEIVIEDLEGSLELLLELGAYGDRVALEWPEGKPRLVRPVAARGVKLRVGQDHGWFQVEGSVALDDEQVLDMRFLLDRLDRARGRFVKLDDGSFLALTRQLQAQLGRLAAVSEPHKGGRRVHALAAPMLDAALEGAGEVRADAAWKRHVQRIRAAEGWTPQLPPTLQAELRDYQVEGFTWMSRLARWGAGACLADDMGLGKTVQAIAVLLDQSAEGPSLVVAPTSVCPNWEAEITRFAPTLTPHRLASASDRAALIAAMGPRDVLVTSYGLLHQEAEALGARSWQVAVLDEAQAIKNAQTKRAQASLSLQAGLRLALTGTPVENYLDELWSLFNFVNPGLLGSREGFQKRFAIPIERDRDANARQALRALVRPFLLRRTKAAVLSELPPRTEQTITVEMGETERSFYEALRQKALETIAALDAPAGKRKIHILAEIMKLRRACCNAALIDAAAGIPSAKLEKFLELTEELVRNRHRALVFSQFVGHLALVRAALEARGIAYFMLDGSTPMAERERLVAAFQAGGADLFLISLRAGGTGLNLTAADYVVHLDPWWNPAVEDQASDRAHRMGQERPVTIYRLIMADSIEERILRLHADKRDLAADLLEGAEMSARLGEAELLALIGGTG